MVQNLKLCIQIRGSFRFRGHSDLVVIQIEGSFRFKMSFRLWGSFRYRGSFKFKGVIQIRSHSVLGVIQIKGVIQIQGGYSVFGDHSDQEVIQIQVGNSCNPCNFWLRNMWLKIIYCLKIVSQGNGKIQQRLRIAIFCIERMWFKLTVTSSNWFLLVVAHDK